MLGLMRPELSGDRISKLRSVRHYNGLPIDARAITDDLRAPHSCKAPPTETAQGRAIVGRGAVNVVKIVAKAPDFGRVRSGDQLGQSFERGKAVLRG